MGQRLKKSIYLAEYRLLINRLKACREKLGIPQDKLSKMLGRTRTFVSKVELAERRLDILELISYLKILNLDVKMFLSDYVDEVEMSNEQKDNRQ